MYAPAQSDGQHPPLSIHPQVFYGLGSGVVSAFSAIDAWLEDSRVFSRLLPEEIPKWVTAPW
jgi:hypothetical protein